MKKMLSDDLTMFMKEYEMMSKDEVLSVLCPLIGDRGLKEVCDASGISVSRLNYYFASKKNKPPFDIYLGILMTFLPPSEEELYKKVQKVKPYFLDYTLLGMDTARRNLRKVVDDYGYKQVALSTGLKEGSLHYYFRPQCKNIDFLEYMKVMAVPFTCQMNKKHKRALKEKVVNEKLALLRERLKD